LVKEVKSLRATLGHTTADLEEHRVHLMNLRRAFDAFAPASAMPPDSLMGRA
jgi:hypothetical protein